MKQPVAFYVEQQDVLLNETQKPIEEITVVDIENSQEIATHVLNLIRKIGIKICQSTKQYIENIAFNQIIHKTINIMKQGEAKEFAQTYFVEIPYIRFRQAKMTLNSLILACGCKRRFSGEFEPCNFHKQQTILFADFQRPIIETNNNLYRIQIHIKASTEKPANLPKNTNGVYVSISIILETRIRVSLLQKDMLIAEIEDIADVMITECGCVYLFTVSGRTYLLNKHNHQQNADQPYGKTLEEYKKWFLDSEKIPKVLKKRFLLYSV